MTAKGKMNALVWISASESALHIDADPELRDDLSARLERYIIADDVMLEDVTDEWGLLHWIGSESPLSAAPPAEIRIYKSSRFGLGGLDILGPKTALESVQLPSHQLVDAETLECFRIEQGIPRWGAELDENTIPVEAGLDATAIDYHKGCYIGQEVISRIKSIGHVNWNLCGFVSDAIIAPGAELLHEGKPVANITSSAWSAALEKAVALGYLKRGTEAATLNSPAGEVRVRSLPLIS
jgi:folate-binding protein YgfZ